VASGLLDTSVVIDWHDPAVIAALPDEMAISAITAAEVTASPLLAATPMEAAKRQARLQQVESRLERSLSTAPQYAVTRSSLRPWYTKGDGREADSPIC
jgi:predicted nucleic acid-binding protein